MLPRWRRIAGWGLIALLIAVFPVHVHMLDRADQFAFIPYWILIVRLPLQGLLVAWIWWTSLQHDWK